MTESSSFTQSQTTTILLQDSNLRIAVDGADMTTVEVSIPLASIRTTWCV